MAQPGFKFSNVPLNSIFGVIDSPFVGLNKVTLNPDDSGVGVSDSSGDVMTSVSMADSVAIGPSVASVVGCTSVDAGASVAVELLGLLTRKNTPMIRSKAITMIERRGPARKGLLSTADGANSVSGNVLSIL